MLNSGPYADGYIRMPMSGEHTLQLNPSDYNDHYLLDVAAKDRFLNTLNCGPYAGHGQIRIPTSGEHTEQSDQFDYINRYLLDVADTDRFLNTLNCGPYAGHVHILITYKAVRSI